MAKPMYLFCAILVLGGCSAQTDSGLPSESSDLSSVGVGTGKADHTAVTVFSDEVTWNYRDQIGRGDPELETTVTGFVQIDFYGDDLPVADGSSRLQPAVVQMSLPSFRDPGTLDARVFYVLFETFDGKAYGVYPNFNTSGGGSVVDAELPNALETFNQTYSFITQEGRPTQSLPADESITLNITNNEDRAGTFSLDENFGITEQALFDFAHHTIWVTL